ncbi:MAG: valine--tRNA ligase [Rhodospirillaceae bacterium]|nr:valine--tRNA ligase [Rhodospirillaceae bacterium]
MIDKHFLPKDSESRQYKIWADSLCFKTGKNKNLPPYTIMMPPPNVTGRLHMGHALTFTLQDILIRYHRMRGFDVLWQAGTDHAGIATQMVVERQLEEKQQSRREMGRDQFLKKIWEWKEHSGGMIVDQLKRLGASADWSRERFTMDQGLSEAVTKVFVTLYHDGLIYRDKRLVNWDPKLQTAVSDLEVINKETKGKLYFIRYPYLNDTTQYIVVATTRPETLFGDVAVAINPDDKRYRKSVGQLLKLPLTDRHIPIIADAYSDPKKGSGAVKITPAHDFNDFEVGQRHKLQPINIFNEQAILNDQVPQKFIGLSREKARDLVLKELEQLGLLDHVEDHGLMIPVGDRSGVIIEPRLTDQWYVDAKKLVQPAIDAVKKGQIVFVPQHWEKVYFEWLENIQPWCISRQLWWGHQIPVWYGPDKKIFVAEAEDQAKKLAFNHYKKNVSLKRDEDVLDTWFSSALWPFSTLGWPEETADLKRYYPTDVLVTGFDIIFFWVARMVMMGLYFMKEVPFKTVYINALVRDQHGQKMSKTKGNIIDPIDLIDKYGTDALRFALASQAVPGQDIKLSEERVEGHRNFVTKIWNAARFCQMNECAYDAVVNVESVQSPINQWVLSHLSTVIKQMTEALNGYRFHDAAQILYQFVWSRFCDWYLELAKPMLMDVQPHIQQETRKTVAWVFNHILRLLHPSMPFVTEELWQHFSNGKQLLISAKWPEQLKLKSDAQAIEDVDFIIDLIAHIRSIRTEMNVPAAATLAISVLLADVKQWQRLDSYIPIIKRLARVEKIERVTKPLNERQVSHSVLGDVSVFIHLQGVLDIQAESSRLSKESIRNGQDIEKLTGKLANEQFLAKADEDVVTEVKEKLSAAEEKQKKILQALQRIQNLVS